MELLINDELIPNDSINRVID